MGVFISVYAWCTCGCACGCACVHYIRNYTHNTSAVLLPAGGGEVAMVTIRGDNVIETTTEGSNTHEAEENYQTRYFTVNLADTNPNTPCEASLAVENLW